MSPSQPPPHNVQSAASLRDPAKSVVALLGVLGLRTAEVPATQELITIGQKGSMRVKKKKARRRSWALPYAPNVAPLENLAEAVVAVAAARGSETAEVLVTKNVVTHGPPALRLAKHEGKKCHGPRKPSAKKVLTLLMVLPEQLSRLPKSLHSKRQKAPRQPKLLQRRPARQRPTLHQKLM